MNAGRTVFAQLMDFIPAHEFRRCVACYEASIESGVFLVGTRFSQWLSYGRGLFEGALSHLFHVSRVVENGNPLFLAVLVGLGLDTVAQRE